MWVNLWLLLFFCKSMWVYYELLVSLTGIFTREMSTCAAVESQCFYLIFALLLSCVCVDARVEQRCVYLESPLTAPVQIVCFLVAKNGVSERSFLGGQSQDLPLLYLCNSGTFFWSICRFQEASSPDSTSATRNSTPVYGVASGMISGPAGVEQAEDQDFMSR